MDLDTICKENFNIETKMENQVNVSDSSREHIFFEEYIDMQEFAIGEPDQDKLYCLGVINILENKVGFITDTYFNRKFVKDNNISIGDTVIFDPQKVRFCKEDFKLQTVKNIYLVKYVLGDYVVNEKTEKEQRTINYDFPIEVLRVFSRNLTAYIHVQDKGVICRYKNEVRKEKMELDEQTRISIQSELLKSMGDSNIFFAPSFPQILKKVGIESYKVYAESIGEFVEIYMTPQFCFCKNLEMNGKVHPGVILYLNGQDKEEVLAGISCTRKKLSVSNIDNAIKEKLQCELTKYMENNPVLLASALPVVLKNIGIEDYKKYATSVEQFVELYLTPKFGFEKNLELYGKIHPGVIILLDGKDISEVLSNIVHNDEGKKKNSLSNSIISEEWKAKIVESLRAAAAETGFIYASAIPGILATIGILDYKQYASSIGLFCEKFVKGDFEFKDKVKIDGKVHSGVLFLKKELKDIERKEEFLSYEDSIFDDFRNNEGVRFGIINVCTGKNGFINQEYVDKRIFPDYILDGTQSTIFETPNVKFKPSTTKLRTVKYIYLVAYYVKGTVINTKNGEEQPALDYSQPVSIIKSVTKKEYAHIKITETGVLIEKIKGQDAIAQEEKVNEVDIQKKYEYLRELYQNRNYYDFLASDFFKESVFCKLPQDIQNAALNCVAKIISSDDDVEINLNRFQRELICNVTAQDFIKKWKQGSNFNQDIMGECAESSVYAYDLSKHGRYIFECLNNIGYSNGRNDNYPNLTKRFGLCYNEILPYMFFIRAVAQESRPAVERCISEFIQVVKNVQQSDIFYYVEDKARLFMFKDFLVAIDKYVLPLNELPRLMKTSIASAFVDVGQMEQYNEMVGIFASTDMNIDRKLLDLYFNFDNCTEQKIRDLLKGNVSIQLLQKVISLVWERYHDVEILPEELVCVLSWICVYDASASIDEILRYHLVNKKFDKLQKIVQLMNSFGKICSMAELDPSIHIMASYIRFVICEDVYGEKFPDRYSEIKEEWKKYSINFYDSIISETGEINDQTENGYLKLFRIFKLDIPNQLKLQNSYSDWYLNQFRETGVEEYRNSLNRLYENGAYKAYCDLVLEYWSNGGENRELLVRQYVSSLLELQRYDDAINFLQQTADVEKSIRNELIIRVLAENFRNYGLSELAFTPFGTDFSVDDAIGLLLAEYKSNQYHLITCLISLYCEKKDYVKAAYLYVIFQSKAENGYTRLYAQIRRKTSSFLGKLKNHYDVVEFAFYALRPDEIITFLEWTEKISIPALKGYNATHPFAFYYEKLMNEPTDEKSWIDFYSHIIKRMDVNAWLIVVCETIMNQVFNYENSINSSNAIRNVINTFRSEELPLNVLPYVFNYIVRNNDVVLCEDLTRLLSNSDTYQRLIEDSLWADNYKEEREHFKTFCLQKFSESGNEIYYKLMSLLGVTYDIKELAVLARTAGDKSFLYRTICKDYVNSINTVEIIELLNDMEWNNMTTRDLKMLNLLRLLYREEEFFQSDKLFGSEVDIYRFKTDCARILSVFPDKEVLFEFDKNCVNNKYKLLVYSYIFNIMYDEDVYHKYEYSYENLSVDAGLYYTYMRFVTTVFEAQLEWNRDYPFFYKKWRYLKLYLATILYTDSIVDGHKILEVMEQNGHYDSLYSEGYRPFIENVNKFWNSEGISQADKKCILYSLMMGRMGDFIQMKGGEIRSYSQDDKLLLKEIISQLDYREVNLSFYQMYWPRIKKGDFTEAEDIAMALSDYTRDVMVAVHNNGADKEVSELFESLALLEKPSDVTKGVFQLEETAFLKHREILLPLLCSRQFVFWIYGSTRTLVVQRKAEPGMLKYTAMTEYISKYNPNEAKAVQGYLLALKACLDKNREEVLSILQNTDIESDIPAQWKREANNIRCYAEGKNSTFRADTTIVDSSLKNEHVDVKLGFIERLQKAHDIERRRLDAENAAALYERYLEQSMDFQERVKACLNLILNYPRLDKEKNRALPLPTKYALILSLGLNVIEEGYFFNTTDRMAILFELYSCRKMFRDNADGKKRLDNLLGQSLKTNISLELWVKYRQIIKEFLEDNHMLMDFAILQERILEKCAILLNEDTSQEKRYMGLKQLLEMSEDLESLYSRNVFDAIRRVCSRIEDSPRLSIAVVNDNQQMTDGFVYFMIQNIGKCTVTLSDDYIVLFKQEGHPERKIAIDSIRDLQSGFITGGKAKLVINGLEDSVSVNLAVFKRTNIEKREKLCDSSEILNISDIVDPLQITSINRYKVGSDSAVTDADMLFGRTEIQNTLKDMIPAGVTVLYGPSRIGKTSIMNWVRNIFAVSQGNVISISFGGEGGMGKESDYQEDFVNRNKHLPVPYDDDAQMAEYLMVSTIIQSITVMKRRLRLPSMKKVSNDVLSRMVEILQDRKMSIDDRYYYVNELLKEEDLELWLLLDEFQQVVERWKPKASCEFVKVCKMLLYDGENSNIKLILSGSDDLLRHMVLEDESVWRVAFPEYARVSVEPLKKDAFCDMIIKDKKLLGTNVSYSSSALDALFSYTGGVALYGKEIGNVILDDMESNPVNYRGRNIVYASDVSEATQRLLNRQASELDTKAKEGIREIYDAVTKNLKPDTDMQYLWYIAKWLKNNPNYDSFAETIFTNNGELRDEKEMHDSLEIAVARGILDCKESDTDGVNNYVFRTIFYYFAFLGSAKNKLDESKIFNQEDSGDIEEVIEENALTMIEKFGELSDSDQMTVLSSVYHQKLNPEARESFRKDIGNQNHNGDIVHGLKVGTQNNIQVNIQNMTNALTNIISGKNLLESYEQLPKLKTYLNSVLSEKKQQALKDKFEELQDTRLSAEQRLLIEDDIYEVSAPAIDAMAGDYVAAEMNAIMNGSYSADGEVQDEEAFYKSIGGSKETLDELKQLLPSGIQIQFDFAVMLHKIFYQLKSEQNVDYCPVAILYCKMVEGLLKEKHFEIYIKKLSRGDFPKVRLGNRDFEWSFFIDRNGEIDREKVRRNRKKLTLGSFSFQLGRIVNPNDFDSSVIVDENVIEALATPVGADDPNTRDLQLWNKHAEMLPWIREYRNKSAHELTPISHNDMDNICKLLFSRKELDTILKLIQRQ